MVTVISDQLRLCVPVFYKARKAVPFDPCCLATSLPTMLCMIDVLQYLVVEGGKRADTNSRS